MCGVTVRVGGVNSSGGEDVLAELITDKLFAQTWTLSSFG